MEKNNTSNSSVCRKIRQALASNPALRAIHHISSYHQQSKPITTDHSNSPSSSPTNTAIQTKPPLPQHHHKVNTEGSGAIPIKFVYSTPKTIENGNSSAPSVPGHEAKVASPVVVNNSERATKVADKGEPQPHGNNADHDAFKRVHSEALRGSMGAQHGHGEQHSEQQGKKTIDINDTFNEYIKRAKEKIRTVSNIGRGQNSPTTILDHEAHGINKKEDHYKDHFSDFIHHAKKKFRTTTIVGKTSSMKRG